MAQSVHSLEELVTLTTGRRLFLRKINLGAPADEQSKASVPSTTLQLVFVHGLCGTQAQFDLLVSTLSQQLQIENDKAAESAAAETHQLLSLECLLFDLMGCGQSPMSSDPNDYEQGSTCADLQELLMKQTDTSIPTVLVGHSYGPSIFLSLPSTSHENVVGFIFLGSAVRTPSNPNVDGGHAIFRLPLFMLRCLQPSLNKAFVQQAVHSDNTEIQRLASSECTDNDMSMAKAYHTRTRWATEQQADAVTAGKPCLVIHGVDDQVIPVTAGQELANLVDATLHPVSKASHLVMMEKPEQVASIILGFLKDICLNG